MLFMRLRILLTSCFAITGMAISASAASDVKPLREALTHFVSFDTKLEADFSRGDRVLYVGGNSPHPAEVSDAITLEPAAGRFGGALHVTKKNPACPYFKGPGIVDYKS